MGHRRGLGMDIPSGVKALNYFSSTYEAAKSAPFQSVDFFRGFRERHHVLDTRFNTG